jgi:signal transduction histidine kinase
MNAIGVAVVQNGRQPHPGGSMETHDSPTGAGAKPRGDGNHTEQAAIETLEQILGSMVHAISNSLNSVMAASQLANLLITQGRLDEAKASLNRVEEECTRAARLVRDGRNLATLRVPDSLDGVDVATLLASCAAACDDIVEVRVETHAELRVVQVPDEAKKRLFVEILDNAFQFGARGIAVSANRDPERGAIRIEFRDDGPGVNLRPDTLFDAFVTSDPAEHSGLGLAIATQIAAAYDGSVGLDQSPSGAMFWVRLPVASS